MKRTFENVAVKVQDVCPLHLAKLTEYLKRALYKIKVIREKYTPLVVSASEKSIVWKVISRDLSSAWILKKHSYQKNYEDEVLGYSILRGGAIPKLLYSNRRRKILVLEYIDGRAPMATRRDLELVINAYAQLHTLADHNIKLALDEPAENFFRDNIPEAIAQYYELFPEEKKRHPVSIGDVKHEHVLIKEGQAYIIDLDTFSLCRSEWFDVAALECFARSPYDLDWIIVKYLESRGMDSDETIVQKARSYISYLQGLYSNSFVQEMKK